MPQVRILSSGPHKENYPLRVVLFVFFYCRVGSAAACEQSKALALGKILVRCRWQMKDKDFGAAVDKIEEKRKPEDFIGHRKPAAKPKMPRVRVSPLGPNKQKWLLCRFCLFLLNARLE